MRAHNIFDYSRQTGLSLSELGKRGGTKAGRKRSKQAKLRKEFEAVQERGDDWWNK